MKNWKKWLACLLAGMMMLALLTGCEGGLNLGVTVVGTGLVNEKKCQSLAEKLSQDLTYDEELSGEAKKVADFLVNNKLELKEGNDGLVRSTTAMPTGDYTTIQYFTDGDLVDALLAYDCYLTRAEYGFGFAYEVDEYNAVVYFTAPKEGTVTREMLAAAVGKTEIGAAYIMTSNGTYVVVLFR